MVEKIAETLKLQFSDFTFKVDKDDEKQTAKISAEKDLTQGFDVDLNLESNEIIITHGSKLMTYSYFAVFGITALLTYFFGWQILDAFGLVSDGGRTMKLLFIIPVFIFLIPSFIASTLIMKKISPQDDELLQNVKGKLVELGHEAIIE